MHSEVSQSAQRVAERLLEKKAQDIRIVDISGMTIIADAFVIASGRTVVQTRALYDELLEKEGPPRRAEGYAAGRWIMMDYGDILVHIFHEEEREFYDLERLWDRG
ncbi:MAG: ribosome silencing factor, partial [Clostridiales bacterium]|nr:ribosome silencing factor [Clostridiales bacterium]